MQLNHSFRHLSSTIFLAATIASLGLSSTQAGSFIGFRDGNANAAFVNSSEGTKITQTTKTPSGPSLNRHGADDPANHDLGDDRGRHHRGAGHR
jgi:hypothetical protein